MKTIRRMEELPDRPLFILPNWEKKGQYRATAWAYLNRADGGPRVEYDRQSYRLHIVHFALNQDDMRQKTGNSGNFKTQALCGSGNYHEAKSKGGVTCPKCLEIMETGKHKRYL